MMASRTYVPTSIDTFDFANVAWADLQDSGDVVRTVFDVTGLPETTLSTSAAGMRASWNVSTSPAHPDSNPDRYEVRQTNIGLVPNIGDTEYWRYEFILNNYPDATTQIWGPVTITQLFDHGSGSPRFTITITGESQYSGTYNRDIHTNVSEVSEIVHSGVLLNDAGGTNVIEVARYYHASNGYVTFKINGSVIRTEENINTSPNGGHGLQMGMYPHGFSDSALGSTTRANQVSAAGGNVLNRNFDFTIVSYRKEIYSEQVPVSYFN